MEHIPGPAEFWKSLNEAEAQRKAQLTSAREIRASGNHLAAQNDEPEPTRSPRLTADALNHLEQQ